MSAQPAVPAAAEGDLALVHRILAGDRSAFADLMRLHNRRLYRLARAALRSSTDAEDALQEAYLRAYQSLHQFRGDASLSTWLSRLLLNECFGRLRRGNRRQNVVPIVGSPAQIDSVADLDHDRPDRAAARAEMRALIEAKLDELPEDFRIVFVLRSIEELSVEETAQTLGIQEATVRSRHFRAKSLLREGLARELEIAERDVFEFGGIRCDRMVERVMHRLPAADQGPRESTPKIPAQSRQVIRVQVGSTVVSNAASSSPESAASSRLRAAGSLAPYARAGDRPMSRCR